ncbi:MAG TPA: hypothetical protein PJ991_03085 [Kiritimatiellia bacterium]|nr:hypothetical protein [Kiritimatiellia bacterium]
MKKLTCFMAAMLMAGSLSTASAQDNFGDSLHEIIKGRLAIGFRSTYFDLTDDKKGEFRADGSFVNGSGFLGSIVELDARQNYMPLPYIQWFFSEYFALELGYERLKARTVRYTDGGSDGTFKLNGPSIQALGFLPNESAFTPFIGVGVIFFNADFDHDGLWHNGFGGGNAQENYNNWRASGSPAWPNGGYRRNIDASNTTAYFFSFGTSYDITENIILELFIRYMKAEVDGHFYLSRYDEIFQDSGTTTFPLDNWSGQLGIKWLF